MRRRLPDEDGMTLVELLVVLFLTSIVAALLLGVLNQTLLTTSRASENATIETDAQLTMRRVMQDLRAATSIVGTGTPPTSACAATPNSYPAAYGNCLSFEIKRSKLSSDECSKSLITYGLVAGELRLTRADVPAGAAPCGAPVTRNSGLVLLKGITNSASQPLFQYQDNFTNRITGSSTASIPLYQSARTVRMTFQVTSPHTKKSLLFTSTAALRNNR